jgi:uroporphyrinogen III methyltransferase/synthase
LTVFLVGAGPGDAGLITARGLELVRRCDALVVDELVASELVDEAPDDALVVRRAGMTQPAVDELLVELGRDGLDVVRLKGGDPFVFGRGGEEALACARAGVPFEVVPGVSAAIAAPASAGIPVTHRGLARSVAVVTASTAHGDGVDLAAVATTTDTLVLLMAAGKLEETCRSLIDAGRPPEEPAAIVQWATTAEQRQVIGTLGDLPALALAASIGPPATLIVGAVAALAHELAPAARPAEASTRG